MVVRFQRPLIRGAVAALVFLCGLTLSQDIHIFPGLIDGALRKYAFANASEALPPRVRSHFLPVSGGDILEVWKMASTELPSATRKAALIFHGNGGDLSDFFSYQKKFSLAGYDTYAFDYRGFGRSTGWFREETLYDDTDRVIQLVQREEDIPASEILLVGISVGTGPAAYAALYHNSRQLVLIAPYTSIPDVVQQTSIFGFLSPLLWTELPTKTFVRGLDRTCVVAAHGKNDHTIPFTQTLDLQKSYRGSGTFTALINNRAGHEHIFDAEWPAIRRKLAECDLHTIPQPPQFIRTSSSNRNAPLVIN